MIQLAEGFRFCVVKANTATNCVQVAHSSSFGAITLLVGLSDL